MRNSIVLFFLLIPVIFFGQENKVGRYYQRIKTDSLTVYSVLIAGGSELIGAAVEKDSTEFVLKILKGSEIKISWDQVERLRRLPGEWNDKAFHRYDMNSTRLFLSPTAKTIPGGTGYISTAELFFPIFIWGITDYWSLGGGLMIPITRPPIYYFFTKVRFIKYESLHFAAGGFYIILNKDEHLIPYIGFTHDMGKFDLSLGFGFDQQLNTANPYKNKNSVLIIGGEYRPNEGGALITENWLSFKSSTIIFSLGYRIYGTSFACDIGALWSSTFENTSLTLFPWLGLTINFN